MQSMMTDIESSFLARKSYITRSALLVRSAFTERREKTLRLTVKGNNLVGTQIGKKPGESLVAIRTTYD